MKMTVSPSNMTLIHCGKMNGKHMENISVKFWRFCFQVNTIGMISLNFRKVTSWKL